ncbi:SPOR domain-containing protein [bacterium]|nr:SPOR domain-containing protein [bacterium]
MNIRYCIICAACAVLLASCNPSRFGWAPEDGRSSGKDSPAMIEDFDPLTLEDDDIVVEEHAVAEPRPEQRQPFRTLENESDTEKAEPKMVPGFRVQLMSAKDEAQIIEEKKKAMFKFQQTIYVVFESPYYKIRLGDFLTHDAAAVMQEEAQRKGFPGAFIARCLVDRTKAGQ